MLRRNLILVREMGQHGHKPPVLVKNEHPFFVCASGNMDLLKSKAQTAASFRSRWS
jgi:hypothetical protein